MVSFVLSRREKKIVLAAGLVLVCVMGDQFVLSPLQSWRARVTRGIAVKSGTLEELKALAVRYRSIQAENQGAARTLAARKEDFTLFGFLERVAGETGVKRNIASMKPGSSEDKATGLRFSLVEMRLEDVGMMDLTRLLFHLENAPENVKIRSLAITRKAGREPAVLSVILNVQTLAGQG